MMREDGLPHYYLRTKGEAKTCIVKMHKAKFEKKECKVQIQELLHVSVLSKIIVNNISVVISTSNLTFFRWMSSMGSLCHIKVNDE